LGGTYLRIHYSADPGKDRAWAAEEMAKSPRREWDREMEMNENVYDGEPVFPEYRDAWHCLLQDRAIEVMPGSVYVGGWDCGQTLSPAFVLLQICPRPFQIHAILEVLPNGPEPMEKFAPRVSRALGNRLPGMWDEVRHYGDATVTTRSGSTGDTAQGIARKHGISILGSSNEWQGRYSAVTWLLQDSIDHKTPRFLIDGLHCPTLRDGFRGAYKFEDTAKSEGLGAARILAMPLKNAYSHVQDALQYAGNETRRRWFGVQKEGRRRVAG
jgi:hypothetical protein